MVNASPALLKRWALLLFLITTTYVSSNENNLFELSFEQLLQVNVVSKTEESLLLSPGVVSVHTIEELTALGLYTLPDMLSFTAGVEVVKSLNGIYVVQVRGLADAHNQKVLFLLDGVPYWMPSHGDIPLTGIPVTSIEKIEVVRGPASVIYGTNSSSAVINIVTKNREKDVWQVSSISYGSINSSVYFSEEIADGTLDIAFEVQEENGYDAVALNSFGPFDPSCFCFPNVPNSQVENKSEHSSFWARYKDDTLSLSFHKFRENIFTFTNGSVLSPTDFQNDGELIAVSYIKSFEDTQLEFSTDWNRYYWTREITDILSFVGIEGDGSIKFENSGNDNYRWRNGINIKHKVNEHWSLLSGLETEIRKTAKNTFRDGSGGVNLAALTQPPFNLPFQLEADGTITLLDKQELTENSVYLQADFKDDWGRMVIGARYTDNEFSGNNVAPRLSFVINHDEHQSWKFLYAEGFNSPTFRQISARNNFGGTLNINVSAEIIKTLEVSYNRVYESLHQSVSLFEIRAEDLIQAATFVGIFNSDETVKRTGIEYEFQLRNKHLRLVGNISYLKQGNSIDSMDPAAFFTARWQANLGAEYMYENHRFGFSTRVLSDKAESSGYHWLNIKYSYDRKHWKAFIGLNNLTDQDIFHPDVRGLGVSQLQASDSLNIIAGGEWYF